MARLLLWKETRLSSHVICMSQTCLASFDLILFNIKVPLVKGHLNMTGEHYKALMAQLRSEISAFWFSAWPANNELSVFIYLAERRRGTTVKPIYNTLQKNWQDRVLVILSSFAQSKIIFTSQSIVTFLAKTNTVIIRITFFFFCFPKPLWFQRDGKVL